MSFINRLLGTFFDPRRTFQALSQKPLWVDALIILLIFVGIHGYMIAPYMQNDTILMMENNVKMRERLGEERFEQYLNELRNPSETRVLIRSIILTPVTVLIGFLFSGLIILGMGRMASTQGNYLQVFSILLHANFIDKFLGHAVRLLLVFTRKSVMQTTTSLALFFPRLEVTSPLYVILSQVDFFQLWLFGIFGLGLSTVFKVELKKAFLISYGFWLLKSLFYIGFYVLTRSLFM